MTAVRMSGLVRSQALALRSSATTWVLLFASVVMAMVSFMANFVTFDRGELGLTATVEQLMHASTVATLTFALVAGVVAATSDIRFGRIDQLLLTEPEPRRVVWATALPAAGLGVLYGVAGSIAALIAATGGYRLRDASIDVVSSTVVAPLVGAVVGSALFCVLGVGLGHAIRNQPFAIGAALALLLIVQPPLLIGLPEVGRWLPGAAGLAVTRSPDPELVGPVIGGALAASWAGVGASLGSWRLTRERAGSR